MFTTAQIFTLLFLMLGPFKLLAPYARITRNATPVLARKVAVLATLYASIALLLAATLGERILSSYGIPLPVLKLAGGVVLFVVALMTIVHQFGTQADKNEESAEPSLASSIARLAFPAIVTPYGIAAVITFMAVCPDPRCQLTIGLMVVGIMLLNLAVMLVSRAMFKVLALVLPILGAVLGIVQVALGLLIIHNSLRELLAL